MLTALMLSLPKTLSLQPPVSLPNLHPAWPSPETSKTSHAEQPWLDMYLHVSFQEHPAVPTGPWTKAWLSLPSQASSTLAVLPSTAAPPACTRAYP